MELVRTKFGPRGVLKTKATDVDDPTVDPAFGRVGKQIIENTGPLDTKRMETIDEEFLAAAKDFITRQQQTNKPWFCYFNTTRMHIFTHLKKESQGVTGLGVYPDGMTDGHVGQLLKLLDDLGAADNTIVVYTTDNGAETVTWPDGGSTPFRGEKATNWEGAFRVPCLIRWPGIIKPGTVVNDICAHEDFIPTFAAVAGDPNLVDEVRKGRTLNGKSFKVHLDGSPEAPVGVWTGQFTKLRVPKLYNLRSDPFERGPESIEYALWMTHRVFIQVPAQALVAKYLDSFKDFPPRAHVRFVPKADNSIFQLRLKYPLTRR